MKVLSCWNLVSEKRLLMCIAPFSHLFHFTSLPFNLVAIACHVKPKSLIHKSRVLVVINSLLKFLKVGDTHPYF